VRLRSLTSPLGGHRRRYLGGREIPRPAEGLGAELQGPRQKLPDRHLLIDYNVATVNLDIDGLLESI
jgi:hypothetical protein